MRCYRKHRKYEVEDLKQYNEEVLHERSGKAGSYTGCADDGNEKKSGYAPVYGGREKGKKY